MAMTLVNCLSRVRSAASAVTAAESSAGALDDSPDDDAGQIVRTGRHHAADHEQEQAEHDRRLAPEAIGGGAVGNLQQCLRQSGTDR